ncbi:MAG: bifunctional 3-(3-hydroxy-phenyl)propionate/3-hydroxycinnamic acid hydroxylase [Beijerinckiaceae bacterium]
MSEQAGNQGQTAEVAIVGAGPVGLMIANLLGLAGVQTIVLERNEGLFGLPRAIAYDAETLRTFTQIGLMDAIAPGLIRNPHVRHLNARGKVLMAADFPAVGLYGQSALGTFYQPDFEKVLLAGLSRFPNVRVLFGHAVRAIDQTPQEAVLSVDCSDGARRIAASYVLGCDGGTSAIREMMGAKMIGSTYTERWLVIDAIVKGHDVAGITFNCDPARPRVELPAVGDRVRWEFMQLPGEDDEILKSEDKIRTLVTAHTKYRDFEIERKAVYTFHARVANKWRCGRVFLAGDSAHLMPPFAGQGMNGGIKDAANIAWKLAAVLKGEASEAILDTYEAERSSVVRKMVETSRRLGSIIMATGRATALARDALFSCLNLSGAFRGFIGRGGVLPPPSIDRSALTGAARDSLIGQMMPQPLVRDANGSFRLDTCLGDRQWLALGVGCDPASLLSDHDRDILEALGARFVCINATTTHPRTLSLQTSDADFLDWVAQNAFKAALVRPDHFILDRIAARKDLPALRLFEPALQNRGVSRNAA